MAEELKPRTIRADEETFKKFSQISRETFGNQGQCLSTLIHLYEIEQGKKEIPERQVEIETFQTHLNRLVDMFVNSLQLMNDTELRVKGEFADLLNSKDSVIINLQEEINKKKIKEKELNDLITSMELDKKRIETELKSSKKLIEDYENSIQDKEALNIIMTEQVRALKENQRKAEEIIEQNETLRKEMDEIKNKNQNQEITIEKLNNQLDRTKFEAEKTINEKDSENNRILLQKDINHQLEVENIKKTYQSEIDKYQKKIQELLFKDK